MSGPWHPTGRGRVNSRSPEALGVCDRTGFVFNQRDLVWQHQWVGNQLVNLRILVARKYLDVPQPQLRTIIIPPDPLPIYNPRPEQYSEEVPSYMGTLTGLRMTTLSGVYMTMMIEVTPTPDPNQPYLAPPDF